MRKPAGFKGSFYRPNLRIGCRKKGDGETRREVLALVREREEIGRAGRDGMPSDCILFYSWADVKLHERFLDDIDDPDLFHAKRRATVDLFELVESGGCRHQGPLHHFGEAMDRCGEFCDRCTGEDVGARGLPAYVIFHDRTLREVAERRPRTLDQMLEVPGVGPAKLERYGGAFLDELDKDG